ncbi:MAG: hypothetical protein JJU33_09315 [Phycisphaerales bacterium]|nr:hypothetical protein [Phycisphaerales bacterium]
MNTEELRARYRPHRIRVLLVGESPPAGGTFFYAANSNLYRHTREAFESVFDRAWPDEESFFDFLREYGFFLEDLCLEPVNGMTSSERRRARTLGEPALANRIATLRPKAIAVTPKAIAQNVTRSLAAAGIEVEPSMLPFPAMGWQSAYVTAMANFLRSVTSSP